MKNNIRSMLFRTVALLIGGTIVSFAFLVNIDTHSWFTSEATQEIKVTTVENIINGIDVIWDGDNATEIKLIKAEGLNYDPVIYFSVEGEAAEYVMHIDPVLLDEREKTIPIKINSNIKQHIGLMHNNNGNIKGKIGIKHLNEFVNESVEISFTPQYLKTKYLENKVTREVQNTKVTDKETLEEATELITLVTEAFEWEEDYKSFSLYNMTSDSIYSSDINTLSSEEDSDSLSVEQFRVLPNMIIKLTPHQNQIISLISYKLLPHVEKLYKAIEGLIEILNQKLIEIARLTVKVEEQTAKIEELENKNKELIEKGEELEKENTELKEEVLALIADKKVLSKEIEALESRIDSLSSNNVDLSRENSQLIVEIENLRRQIDELMARDSGGSDAPPMEEPENLENPEIPEIPEIPEGPKESLPEPVPELTPEPMPLPES